MSIGKKLSLIEHLFAAFRVEQSTPAIDPHRRDRKIGQIYPEDRFSPYAQLLKWVELPGSPWSEKPTNRLSPAHRLISFILLLLGLIAGWLFAATVLHYDGSQPINIIQALLLLVGLQLVLLILWLILLLPFNVFAQLLHAIKVIQPGALGIKFWDKISDHMSTDLFVDMSSLDRNMWMHSIKWLAVRWSQMFSIGFNLGALAAIYYLVTFTDLAFGWNTTLNIDNESFYAMIRTISTPWQYLQPAHAPDLHLIDISRYYRLDNSMSSSAGDLFKTARAANLGKWWPFLIWSVVFYGLLPRLVTFMVASIISNRALSKLITDNRSSLTLLSRMNTPLLRTQAVTDEHSQLNTARSSGLRVQMDGPLNGIIIDWADTGVDDEVLKQAGIKRSEFYAAGGSNTPRQDGKVIELISQSASKAVIILVRGHEPPMLEMIDFVRNLRNSCGKHMTIHIRLTAPDDLTKPQQHSNLEIWEQKMSELSDGDLYVDVF